MKPYTAIKPRLYPVAERYSSPNRRLTAWRSPNTTISSIRKTTEASKRVFFLFSRTKIGRSRPSINDRYAISAQNILRSCVVRYFLPKFIAGCPSVSWWMFKKKEKKMCRGCAGDTGNYVHLCVFPVASALPVTWRLLRDGYLIALDKRFCSRAWYCNRSAYFSFFVSASNVW